MRRLVWMGTLAAALASATAVLAEEQKAAMTFEVASVRPATLPPGEMPNPLWTGGPGTPDPTNFRCRCAPMAMLLTRAYGVEWLQLRAPDWMWHTESGFQIAAKVPPGATEAQFQEMLKNLLIERFHLTVHRETKPVPAYSLVVGKGGPKLKPHVVPKDAPPLDPATDVPNGSGRPWSWTPVERHYRLSAQNWPIGDFAGFLKTVIQQPVSDETGLAERYDIVFNYAPPNWPAATTNDDDTSGLAPDVTRAVQDQLGLKLVEKQQPREFVVVDHCDKTPAEN